MISYLLMNPTGNITILVETPVPEEEQPSLALKLMEQEKSAEQVGFLSPGGGCDLSLRMAGGEFCGNAAMCAAAVCALNQKKSAGAFRIRVSGAASPVPVDIRLQEGGVLQGTVDMPEPAAIEEIELPGYGFFPIVRMEGISHIIAASKALSGITDAEAEALLRERCLFLGESALGLMFFDEESASLRPLVYVPGADTVFWENSCASGTAACGAWLSRRDGHSVSLTLREPAGSLRIESSEGSLRLTGSVSVLKRGVF